MQNMLMHDNSVWLRRRLQSSRAVGETAGQSLGIRAAAVSDMSEALLLTLLHI